MGDFDTVETLKTRIAGDLRREAEIETRRGVRRDLVKQLSSRLTVEVPEALVDREIARRLEQIAARMAQQGMDPRTAKVDWETLGEEQRGPALEAVRASVVPRRGGGGART